MKLARIAEGKKIKRWFIPLFAILLTSLVFSTGSVSAVPVTIFHSTFDTYDMDNSIEGWTVRTSSGTQDSYAGDGVLILYPNEGIDRKISQDSIPREFNVSIRFNLYSTYWHDKDDIAYIWDMNQNNFNTGSSGYTLMTSFVEYVDANDTFTFTITNGYSGYVRYYGMDPAYAWGLELTFHRWDASGGGGAYHIVTFDASLWRDYYVAPGDEITIPIGTNLSAKYTLDDENFGDVYLRIGPYSAGSYSSPGDLWLKDVNVWWDDSTTPPGPEDDYNDTEVIIENLVQQIVFFIPILVLTSFFGRIGFIGGVGLMSVIWMFTDSSFIAPGMMIFIALGILVYKGGME
jgi:hypothetical protein